MNSKVDIKGEVDFAISQNHGPITINKNYMVAADVEGSPQDPTVDAELNWAIHELLRTCDPVGQRELIQKIAKELYATKSFKSLNVEQVRVLVGIAEDIASSINKAVLDQKRSIAREEDEFQKEYGMLASAPAREAINLLVNENLTTKQVARAWRSGMLTFEDNNQFSVTQSRFEKAFGVFLFSLGVVFVIPPYFAIPLLDSFFSGGINGLGKAQILTIFGISFGAAIGFFWLSTKILTPHHAVSRVAKHIDKVNEILKARWRS